MKTNPFVTVALVMYGGAIIMISALFIRYTDTTIAELKKEISDLKLARMNDQTAADLKSKDIWYVVSIGTVSSEPDGKGRHIDFDARPTCDTYNMGSHAQTGVSGWGHTFVADNYGKKVRFIEARWLPSQYRPGWSVLNGAYVMQLVE